MNSLIQAIQRCNWAKCENSNQVSSVFFVFHQKMIQLIQYYSPTLYNVVLLLVMKDLGKHLPILSILLSATFSTLKLDNFDKF